MTKSIGDGENPPSERINQDYKQQLSNPRKCVECGKTHDTIVENTMTGERLREIEKCKDCLIFGTVIEPKYKVALGKHDFPINYTSTEWGGSARCMTSDGRNVNMAEELNRLELESAGTAKGFSQWIKILTLLLGKN